MSKFSSGLGSNTGAVIAGGATMVLLALGAYLAFGRGDVTSEGIAVSVPDDASASQGAQSATTDVQETVAQEPAVQAPSFDELRREPDGTTIIAGRAAPLSEVKILLDDEEVATVKADASGGFAAIAMLPPAAAAQVVSLSSRNAQTDFASVDEIILAPSTKAAVSPPVQAEQAEVPIQQATPEQGEAAQSEVEQSNIETANLAVTQPQEPTSVAVLKSDADGVSLLNAPKPQAMTSVALDTIGYSELGDVQLTGRAQSNTSMVRIYLDSKPVISLPIATDGRWRGDLPDVDEGVYTLRVDEIDAQGAVSSRVETPFKRESVTALAQAAAASDDGPVKSITVQTGSTLWAIARERYGDGTLYVRVFEANTGSIRDPDLIYPGQVFDLPN
ncbi:nucleoid-associated protein YgaU [Sulfitobacter undariae]|uniref:Nucleoid-associated protein YgaU n=1 Tax=Sulfitobacter undariae TaxID=1563671 RepID=A0A7W6H214_9RHOB|nr:LysM peptidoglycan-binding domain-containing protein [Sulfitobacter undariae]MBB3995343.1 nucleoid-associated protein YgaU [Sulfitobacter undariae]